MYLDKNKIFYPSVDDESELTSLGSDSSSGPCTRDQKCELLL